MIIEEEYQSASENGEIKNKFKTGLNSRGDSTAQLKDAMNWPFENEYKKKVTTIE